VYFARIGRENAELSGTKNEWKIRYSKKSFSLVIPDLIRDPDLSSGLVEELKQFPRIPELNWLRRRNKGL
jgi:hypothetical protein